MVFSFREHEIGRLTLLSKQTMAERSTQLAKIKLLQNGFAVWIAKHKLIQTTSDTLRYLLDVPGWKTQEWLDNVSQGREFWIFKRYTGCWWPQNSNTTQRN